MSVIVAILQAVLLVAAAPLVSGITRKIRAKMHSRTGTDIFQDYRDLAKLWRRCEVREGGSGLVSRAMPPVFLGSFVLIAAGLPLFMQACPVPILGDIITILYLMALPRFMFALASIDSAGSYTAIGGVRELLVGVLVEPALVLVLFVMAVAAGSTNTGLMAAATGSLQAQPLVAVVVAGVAFAMACYIEMGKLPFDLAEAEQDRPAPDGLQRRIEEAEQAGEGGRHHQHHRQALVPGASGEPGREQGGDQLQHHRAGQHQAGFYRSHAAVDQDRRQPTEDDVGQGRLQAHVQRDLPGQRVAPQADDTEGLAMGVLALAGLRQPEGGGEDRRQRPERQRQFPVAEELLQRRGSAGGERCAQAQGHGVDPGHHPGLAREVAFDDARQEHADDADAGAGQDAAGEQAEHREQAAQDDAAGQAEEDQQHAAFGADTPGQARRERREQPQAEYRRGGQQAGGGGREAGIVAYLVEQGGEAGQRRAQVQRHQHQAQQEQPGA